MGKTLGGADCRCFGVYPLPPYLLKALLGAALAKSVCKILMSNNLEVKILTTNDLGHGEWLCN
jgi:hypothetical protein